MLHVGQFQLPRGTCKTGGIQATSVSQARHVATAIQVSKEPRPCTARTLQLLRKFGRCQQQTFRMQTIVLIIRKVHGSCSLSLGM